MAIKTYILDTNVLLYDCDSFQQFEDNHVAIPLGVIRELDKFKKDMTEVGRNARMATRLLDDLRRKGNLANGVESGVGGIIQVIQSEDVPGRPVDHEILDVARKLNSVEKPCIVVTKDVNLRIQCDVMGISAEDYETGQVDIFSEIYTGYIKINVTGEQINEFRHDGQLALPEGDFSANQYVHMTSENNDKAMGRVNAEKTAIIPLIRAPREMGAVQPKNMEQNFFMDALLDDSIHLVTVAGRAGSGKTLMSVAAGFYLAAECNKYMKLLVSRPVFPMGKDLGFLPGTISEKLDPWMRPIYDAFDFIADHRPDKKNKGKFKDKDRDKSDGPKKTDGKKLMEDSGKVEIEPLVYIRGRSIHRQFVIVDECQNLTPLEIKTIVTRAGPGTKIVLTGDIYQIDNPYVDSMSNGLSYVIGRLRGQKLYAHISLEKGVRSPLSDMAASLL